MKIRTMSSCLLAILAGVFFLSGCDHSATAETPPAADSSTASDKKSAPEVTAEFKSWAESQKAAQEAGTVAVVDLWSVYCTECIEELPGLVELQKKYEDKVRCISVSVDYFEGAEKDEVEQEVLAVLQKLNLTVENHIQSNPKFDVARDLGGIAIPVVMVYDAKGELKKTFHNGDKEYGDSGFTYEKHVGPFVDGLVRGAEAAN